MAVERRKATRHSLIEYLQVYDQETKDLLGRVVDVSEKGMMIIGNEPYEPETGTRKLRMMLPKYFEGQEHMDFEAECRWTAPDINDDFFDGGFEFVNLTDDLKDTLDLVVEELSFGRPLESEEEDG